MTPREYLDTICRPSFEEFRAEPASIRRAWISAAALYHFADCLEKSRNEGMPIIRERLSVAFPRFQALADIANAGKHLELDRGPRTGLAAQHFQIGQGAAFSDGTYFSDGTTFSDAPEVVRVLKGATIDVLGLCEAALAAWEGLT
ncbi:hypothetical protein [Methylocystis sp. SB2]|uniref:hypothetical protein n=1 Tax=Methylocystis sp. (strain SB2) TaxID=743836 RepID=UPI0012EE9B0C|nr:hypothetical protein [Methylocystis sp. SB2]ULO24176.1 hypothetical protein LNB28_01835 [Methylocystis sp. SB2]